MATKFSQLPLAGSLVGDETLIGLKPSGSESDEENVQITVDDLTQYVLNQDSNTGGGGGGSGDVTAAASLDDNALVRGDGGVKGVQKTGITVTDSDEISGQKGNINAQTGTTYTLLASDCGKIITFSNGSAITVTAPNSLAAGWNATIVQKGAGQVTISAGSGATVRNRSSHTKLAGQYAVGILYVDSNSGGSAADYYLGGDTAA